MVERLVQSGPKGTAEALKGLDLSVHAGRDSVSSRRKSIEDISLTDDVGATNTNAVSPLSSLFDNEMVGCIPVHHVLAKWISRLVET